MHYICNVMSENEIIFHINGRNGNEKLTPSNFDIRQIRALFDVVEPLVYPDRKLRQTRPIISYEMKEGSVVNVFKTSLQGVLMVSSMITAIESQSGSIDMLETDSAKAIENMQDFAIRNNYDISIKTSDKPERTFAINPETHYVRHDNIMVGIESYFYGKLVDAGGKDKANIHLLTRDFGLLTIKSDKIYLADYKGNPLYRDFAVRVRAKQNIVTGDIDKSSLELIELVDYQPRYDNDYLQALITKATPKWTDVDTDKWVNEIRGGN